MIRTLSAVLLLSGFAAFLVSCDSDGPAPVDLALLSTDVHLSVAQHALILPFVALADHAYDQQSFSLNRKEERERAPNALSKFLRDSADPKHPLELDGFAVLVRTYGWNDGDMRQRQICPRLTRNWARSVCDDPWAALQQALPVNAFRLGDLRRLQVGDPRGHVRCKAAGAPRPSPQAPGKPVLACEARVHGAEDGKFHHAVIRIDGDLGAVWTVWRGGAHGETAEAMAEREGQAIVAFVRHALGRTEAFRELHAAMCRLRRPGASDGPRGSDCRRVDRSGFAGKP